MSLYLLLPVGARVYFRDDQDARHFSVAAYVRTGVITMARRDPSPHYHVRCDNGRTYAAFFGQLGLEFPQPDSEELRQAFARALLDAAEGPCLLASMVRTGKEHR